ncbi:MAG: hypothetical protein E6J87_15675 [Deltaproteobacteria bacterium]|nr:MAG: hypothetical protein E6J87_15675 [Deltaproteobacteria bacterium]
MSNHEVAIDQKCQTRVWKPSVSSSSSKCSLPVKSISRSFCFAPSSTAKWIPTADSPSGSISKLTLAR